MCFFCESYGDHRDLHGLTHSFPTRRSSDLAAVEIIFGGQVDAVRFLRTQVGIAARAVVDQEHIAHDRERFRRVERAEIGRSEEHTSELPSLMRISYAVFCLKKKKKQQI